MQKSKARQRDAVATRKRILASATKEFSRNGLGGGRIDVIAARAKANKRMIYHYYGSKEALFRTVIEQAWLALRSAEKELLLDHLAPAGAIEALVRFSWEYYIVHPEFITLVNSENLHRAKHLKKCKPVPLLSNIFDARSRSCCSAEYGTVCSGKVSMPHSLLSPSQP